MYFGSDDTEAINVTHWDKCLLSKPEAQRVDSGPRGLISGFRMSTGLYVPSLHLRLLTFMSHKER